MARKQKRFRKPKNVLSISLHFSSPLWHPMFLLEETQKKTLESLSEFEKDRRKEERVSKEAQREVPRTIPKGSSEGRELFRQIRALTHMRPIAEAKPKPVLQAPQPVRIAPPRVAPQENSKKIEAFLQLHEKLKGKL